MDLEYYGIDIHTEMLSFEEFCSKINFLIPDHYKNCTIKFDYEKEFIVDETILDFIGYEGKFRTKNQNFKNLLNDVNQRNENDKFIIPHNLITIKSTNFVKITFFNFITAIMKMKTTKAIEIRIFLGKFLFAKERYSQYLKKRYENNQNEEINKLKIDNEIVLLKHKMMIMQKEHEIEQLRQAQELLRKDAKIEVLQKDIELLRKSNEIISLEKCVGNLEKNIEKLLPNSVVPPNTVDKRQRFCLIDNGDNIEGRAIKRQRCSFDKAKRNYLLSHENGTVLLEIQYSSNAIYFFNNIKEFAKKELKNKISIVNSKIKIISHEYNLNMFIQDLLDNFHEEFKYYDYHVYINQ